LFVALTCGYSKFLQEKNIGGRAGTDFRLGKRAIAVAKRREADKEARAARPYPLGR
jgi:hypothetical protein